MENHLAYILFYFSLIWEKLGANFQKMQLFSDMPFLFDDYFAFLNHWLSLIEDKIIPHNPNAPGHMD
jgi:hypothetical protein